MVADRVAIGLALALALAKPWSLVAQQAANESTAVMGSDSSIHEGRLSNGVHYVVETHAWPPGRAELRLVVNAGSVLEADDQRGLAHLIEHLAFDGTKHFPKHTLLAYLQAIGMQFGADVNAVTGMDETIYVLTLPSDSAQFVDRGVQILGDWADGVTFDSAEVVRERQVVVEEWRSGRNVGARIRDVVDTALYHGSHYATREPIGSPAIVAHATASQLKRFYADWYRPDLLTVVVVGDVNADRVVQAIRSRFGAMPRRASERPRPVYFVPARVTTATAVVTDSDVATSGVSIYYRRPRLQRRTVADFRRGWTRELVVVGLGARLAARTLEAAPPFLNARAYDGTLTPRVESLTLEADVAPGLEMDALQALASEAEGVRRTGFTDVEVERARTVLTRRAGPAPGEGRQIASSELAGTIVDRVVAGESVTDPVSQAAIARRVIPTISAGDVNRAAAEWLGDSDRTLVVTAPRSGQSTLGPRALRDAFDDGRRAPATMATEALVTEPLIADPPTPGPVVSEERDTAAGTWTWMLANGVRVILKPTPFNPDQVLVQAYRSGGTSTVADSDQMLAALAPGAAGSGGWGSFDRLTLEKRLAGKSGGSAAWIDTYSEGARGNASPRDFETLLQLIYLQLTAPRVDSAAFAAWQARTRTRLAERAASVDAAYADTIDAVMSRHHPRARQLQASDVDHLSLARAIAWYQARFGNAVGLTFIVVGAVDPAVARPLIERYVGGLPAHGVRAPVRDLGIVPPNGVVVTTVHRGVDPDALATIVFDGPIDDTRENRFALNAVEAVLNLRLVEVLRQTLGGSYSPRATAEVSHLPQPTYRVEITFGAAPDRLADLKRTFLVELDRLRTVGPTEEEVAIVRAQDSRARENVARTNEFWVYQIETSEENDWPLDGVFGYSALVSRLSKEQIRAAAARYLTADHYADFSLYPDTSH